MTVKISEIDKIEKRLLIEQKLQCKSWLVETIYKIDTPG